MFSSVLELLGCGQAVKARGFDPRIPRFESWHPSQFACGVVRRAGRLQATDRARIVLTCMDALMPRAQDARERPTILLHFHHCTCDLQGRRKVEQRRSSCRDVQVPRSTGRARAAIPGGQMSEVRAMQATGRDAGS